MLNIYKVIQVVFVLLMLYSCKGNIFSNEAEMLAYVKHPENGYVHQKTVNGIDYTLYYRPTDMIVNQHTNKGITKRQIDSLREKYDKYLYFNLSMSKNNQELLLSAAKSRNEFGAMVNQLAFGMDKKVHMYTAHKDTITMVDFIYPRVYGMSNSTTMMFVFPREDAMKDEVLNFTIEDLGLYTGEVKFKIATDLIDNEPELKFKS